MSKTWGGIGAWAAETEREEAEERESAALSASQGSFYEAQSFPSLKESATTKQRRKTVHISELTTGNYVGPGGAVRRDTSAPEYNRLTHDEILHLPKGPKERSAEEMQYARRGFYSHGIGPGSGRPRGGDSDPSWGEGRRSYDDDRRPGRDRVSDFDQPSRADEVDNWASEKKTMPSFQADSGRGNRFSSLGGGGGGARADDVDNWASGKKQLPSRSTFGYGFRDSEGGERSRGELQEVQRERPRLILNPRSSNVVNEPVKMSRPSPFGEAKPREEVLAEKETLKKLDSENEMKTSSRPNSSQSSRPSSAQSNRSEGVGVQGHEVPVKPRVKVNPFGDAKPREVLLEEKGKDWRKIDNELEHRGVDRAETGEERILKEEIENLKKQKEGAGGEEGDEMREVMVAKERELEQLVRDLDDKVRFRGIGVERPRSGGRGGPTSFDEGRSGEFGERPGSRGGKADVWTRPPEEERSHYERGYDHWKGMDNRSRSREGW